MKNRFKLISLLLTFAATTLSAQTPNTAWLEPYRPVAARLIAESQSSDFAWQRLAEMTDTFGHRLSGSPGLERTIDWAVATMKADGLENVRKEPVMVPKWIRGRESLEVLAPTGQAIPVLALGGSVATSATGLEGDLVVVKNYEDLERRAADVRGKVVVYNVPFTSYGETVAYRRSGPSRAARLGAIGVLVRSVGPVGMRTVHTGGTVYDAGVTQVPAAAISAEDADRFDRLQARRVPTRVRLKLESHFEPDAQSFNVIGELRGRERPDEIVVVGGHIDSWDVGVGATDDGGGCVVTWEALRLMKKLGLRPRRTVRVVLFTNEENGARGGAAYRDAHRAELANHIAMLESDIGVFDPTGFGFTYDPASAGKPGAELAQQAVAAVASLLKAIGADRVEGPGGGTDIEPAATAGNIPMLGHNQPGGLSSQLYFLVHHTEADTMARITPKQVSDNAAAIAVMAYVLADMETRLGQGR